MANPLIRIHTPQSFDFIGKGVQACVEWDPSFAALYTQAFHKAQCFVDSEVIRLSTPHVPFRQGILNDSATLHTVIGAGEVTYQTPYAARLYFNPQFNFFEAPQRCGLWFEVMKTDHASTIARGAQSFFAGL